MDSTCLRGDVGKFVVPSLFALTGGITLSYMKFGTIFVGKHDKKPAYIVEGKLTIRDLSAVKTILAISSILQLDR